MSPQHAIRAIRWIGSAALAINLCGCTLPSWDDITSREMGVKALWTSPPAPMVVIEKSSDGYARAKAFNKLDETADKTEVEKRLKVLQSAALSDRDPLCRIAALRTLGRYTDPRAGKILIDVYLSNPGLSPENNSFIRQQALTSLQTQSPAEARQLFIQAARQPSGSLTGTAQRDRLEILDERLTSIRALAKYPQPDAVDTLVKLLETEKDTAIRKCAHDALVESQKKDIPADGKAWREYIASGKEPPAKNNSYFAGLMKSEPTKTAAVEPQNSPASPGLLDSFTNWMRTNPDAERRPPQQPSALPNSLPTTPLSSTKQPDVSQPTAPSSPSQLQPTSMLPAPTNAPRVVTIGTPASAPPTPTPARTPANQNAAPAGSYRNPQGELVVPANP